jgi:16S rRNA (guanine527-N7)-methyltransferase
MDVGSGEWCRLIIDGAGSLGVELTADHTRLFARHAEQLLKWNEVINLTTITRPVDIAVNHFVDSLAPVGFIPVDSRVLDVGTGGGFPGLPLHIVIRGLRTTLVDSSRKKVNFLRQVIRELRLERIQALHVRVEALQGYSETNNQYDVIISRAFSALTGFVRMTLHLLKPTGRLIAQKGDIPAAEMEDLRKLTHGSLGDRLALDERRYSLPGLKSKRTLLIMNREFVPAFR